ncbi:MAG: hypothetical protein AAB221_14045 [Bacteroidota bacterium]
MVKIISLNLEGRAHSGLPSGWPDLAKFAGYPLLAASTIIGSANCGGKNSSPTTPTPTNQSPVRSNGQPTGMLPAGTTERIASLETRANASCKYAAAAGVDYDAMPNTFSTTGGTQHSTLVTGLQDGNNYTLSVRCIDPSTGAKNTTDFPISFGVSSPQPGNGIEFTNSIRDIIDGSVPATGTITINGNPGPNIVNGSYTVTKDMNLAIGSRPRIVITAPGYQTREGTFTVTPRGFEADLGGGRTEVPLTLYHDIPGTFTAAEYTAFCLRGGALQRIEAPLTFAVFDKKIYQWQNGRAVEKSDFDMRPTTKNELLKALKEDLASTDNKMYTSGNIDSYIHLQSRGDSLPDLSRGPTQEGWIIITQNSNDTGFGIKQGDNGYQNNGRITAGFMDIRTDQDFHRTQWIADILQTLGTNELRVGVDQLQPYIKTMFLRPVGHTLPDKSQ